MAYSSGGGGECSTAGRVMKVIAVIRAGSLLAGVTVRAGRVLGYLARPLCSVRPRDCEAEAPVPSPPTAYRARVQTPALT